jgi:hypothetical protein
LLLPTKSERELGGPRPRVTPTITELNTRCQATGGSKEGRLGYLLKNLSLTYIIYFAPLGLANYGLSDPGKPAKEPLYKAIKGLISRLLLDLTAYRVGLEPEEIF